MDGRHDADIPLVHHSRMCCCARRTVRLQEASPCWRLVLSSRELRLVEGLAWPTYCRSVPHSAWPH